MSEQSKNLIENKWFKHSDTPYKEELYSIERILFDKQSEKQLIQILELKETGRVLLLDGHFQISNYSKAPYHELITIVSMLFNKKDNSTILIIGGGDGVLLSALYNINKSLNIDLVEYDEEVINVSKQLLNDWNDDIYEKHFGNIIIADAIKFVRKSDDSIYDIIIGDITPPHSGCNSHFWSEEFLIQIKRTLKDGGNAILLGEHINIINNVNTDFFEIACSKFNTVYPLVNVYTGSCIFFMSDRKINMQSFVAEILDIKPPFFQTITVESVYSAIYSGKALISNRNQ